MSTPAGRVVVYGGKGALGATCVSHFKKNNWWVGSVDLHGNPDADLNILLKREDGLSQQENQVKEELNNALQSQKLDAIFCVAGGWAGGNASKDLIKNSELMWSQSIWSSLIAVSVAATHLKEGGFVALTGAKAGLEPTPGMIGYGMAKAAVHHLTKSLGAPNSGLPAGVTTVAILPVTLDTPMNRKWMPKADTTTWTPLEFVADLFLQWSSGQNRPESGSLVQLITKDSKTDLVIA